jgi:hypothetical protein
MRLGNSNATGYLKGANKLVVALIGIFVVLVVGMIVYWIYQAIMKARQGDVMNPILVNGSIDASDSKNAKHWKLPVSSSTNSPNLAFTLTFWMYIADWNYRYTEPKAIMVKGANGVGKEDAAPGIWLARKTNRLVVATRTKARGHLEFCDVDNIPLQKWVQVAYILNNRVVDIYVNGKLERSCVLTGVPLLNNSDLYLIPANPNTSQVAQDMRYGFLGQLSSVRYFSRALRPVDVARLYNEGPHTTKGADSKDAAGTHSGDNGGKCPPAKEAQYTINLPNL